MNKVILFDLSDMWSLELISIYLFLIQIRITSDHTPGTITSLNLVFFSDIQF